MLQILKKNPNVLLETLQYFTFLCKFIFHKDQKRSGIINLISGESLGKVRKKSWKCQGKILEKSGKSQGKNEELVSENHLISVKSQGILSEEVRTNPVLGARLKFGPSRKSKM